MSTSLTSLARCEDFAALATCSFLRAVQRHAVGDAHALRVARLMAFGCQLLVDLGPKAVHQHDFHAHALNERQVLRDVLQLACRNGLARHADHKGFASVQVDVGRHRAEPGHKGKIENG